MKTRELALVLLLAAGASMAQTADESLLAAQMAYQQGNDVLARAEARLTAASRERDLARQRLADAQAAAAKAEEEQKNAEAAVASARETMQTLIRSLDAAWKQKEGGQ